MVWQTHGGPTNYGMGATVRQVTITEIHEEKQVATAKDVDGQHIVVDLRIRRTGITLAVGQTWLVDRQYGVWSFAAQLIPPT